MLSTPILYPQIPRACGFARSGLVFCAPCHRLSIRLARFEPENNAMSVVPTARIEASISPELDDLEPAVVRLSPADQECLARALLTPPEPSAALKRAFARRRELLRVDEHEAEVRSGSQRAREPEA